MNSSLAVKPIPGIPEPALQRLFSMLFSEPNIQAVWLFGSRSMDRHQSGSDIDLCLEGPDLTHLQRLRLMAAVDDLLLPWQVDLVLRHEMPPELEDHLQRVGQCLWSRPA